MASRTNKHQRSTSITVKIAINDNNVDDVNDVNDVNDDVDIFLRTPLRSKNVNGEVCQET